MKFSDIIFVTSGQAYSTLIVGVQDYTYTILGLIFNIAVIVEFFGGNRFDSLVKKLFVAIFLIQSTPIICNSLVGYSLSVSDFFISRFASESVLLNAMKEVDGMDGLSRAAYIAGAIYKSALSMGIISFSYALILAIGFVYSTVFGIVIVLSPFVAALGVLQFASKAHSMVVAGFGFLLVTPIVIGLLVCLMNASYKGQMNSDGLIILDTIKSQIQLCIYCIVLALSGGFSAYIFGTSGIAGFGENISKNAATAVIMKSMAVTKPFGGAVLNRFSEGAKSLASNSASGVSNGFRSIENKTIGDVAKGFLTNGSGILSKLVDGRPSLNESTSSNLSINGSVQKSVNDQIFSGQASGDVINKKPREHKIASSINRLDTQMNATQNTGNVSHIKNSSNLSSAQKSNSFYETKKNLVNSGHANNLKNEIAVRGGSLSKQGSHLEIKRSSALTDFSKTNNKNKV